MCFLPQSYHFYKTYIRLKAHQKMHLLLDLMCWSLHSCWNGIKKLSCFHLRIQLHCKAVPGLGLVSILAELFREVHKTLRVDASWKKKTNIQAVKISVALYLSFSRSSRFKVQFSLYGFSVVLRQSCRSPWFGYIYVKISQILLETKPKRFLVSFNFVLLSLIVSEPI